MSYVFGLKIVLIDDRVIHTDDRSTIEDNLVHQMISYGTKGYYSKTLGMYFPPYQIKSISMIESS